MGGRQIVVTVVVGIAVVVVNVAVHQDIGVIGDHAEHLDLAAAFSRLQRQHAAGLLVAVEAETSTQAKACALVQAGDRYLWQRGIGRGPAEPAFLEYQLGISLAGVGDEILASLVGNNGFDAQPPLAVDQLHGDVRLADRQVGAEFAIVPDRRHLHLLLIDFPGLGLGRSVHDENDGHADGQKAADPKHFFVIFHPSLHSPALFLPLAPDFFRIS